LFNLIESNKFSIIGLRSSSKQLLTEIIEHTITKEKPVVYLCLGFILYNIIKAEKEQEKRVNF
jgi:hypothetical protein